MSRSVSYHRFMIQIELYGVPRLRAGAARLAVEGSSVGDAIDALAVACPSLVTHIIVDGKLHSAYKLSLNGERFVSERATPLSDGDTLLLLSADVGG